MKKFNFQDIESFFIEPVLAPRQGLGRGYGNNKGNGNSKGVTKNWKTNFDEYLELCRIGFRELYGDDEWISKQQSFYPNIDIKKTLEKSYHTYWATKEGWDNKRKRKTETIDWRSTMSKTLGMNPVYYPRGDKHQTTNEDERYINSITAK